MWKRALDEKTKAVLEYGASLHAMSIDKRQSIEALAAGVLHPDDRQAVISAANASGMAFGLAQAHQNEDMEAQSSLFDRLKGLVANYSTLDLLGWMQCLLRYAQYYLAAHSSPQYVDWTDTTPQNWNFGVIEWRLPATSKVLIIGDWGTHMSDNVALLRQALRLQPDAIIHLGDVYYSGTVSECTDNVLNVLDELMPAKRLPFFTLAGNHDYYSGGAGFYDMISRVNSNVPGCLQKASYFCLRTADSRWQFLAMDTGINDRNPVDHMAPSLEKSEVTWHIDKLTSFKGSTILCSHHQLYSANSRIADGPRPYLNESLNTVFKRYYDRVAAWFWGHEHNLVIFKDSQLFPGEQNALRKGRLVGCSAYEETQVENPYDKDPDCTNIEYASDIPRLHISKYKSPTQQFYNHAFTLLEIAPDKIVAKYYEYPSWDQDYKPTPEPDLFNLGFHNPIYTETIAPTLPP